VDVQYFTGSADLQLGFNGFEVDLLHPSKTHVKIFDVDTSASASNVAARLGAEAVSTKDRYSLEVKAAADVHASVLVSLDQTVSVLADGLPTRVFVVNETTRKYTFLPPSDRFQLAVAAKAYTFGVPYEIQLRRVMLNNLSGDGVEYQTSASGVDIFQTFPVEMEGAEALLVTVRFNTSGA